MINLKCHLKSRDRSPACFALHCAISLSRVIACSGGVFKKETQKSVSFFKCEEDISKVFHKELASYPGGGVLPENSDGGVRPASQNPCPIYDLTKNLKPNL